MSIKKGKKLMLFIKDSETYKSVAFATNHTLSTSASTIDITTKDNEDLVDGEGKWSAEAVDTFTWSISAEHLYGTDPQGLSLKEVYTKYAAGESLFIKFALTDNSGTGVPTGGWSANDDMTFSGKGVITSFDFNAPVADNLSASFTLTGQGKLELN